METRPKFWRPEKAMQMVASKTEQGEQSSAPALAAARTATVLCNQLPLLQSVNALAENAV